jgi:hypothetical protein
MIARGRFRRDRHGRYRPGLVALEQELLSQLPRQAQNLLDQDDASVQRVFPVAYPDDAQAQSDYREMMGSSLLRRHQHTLDTLATTADATTIDEDEMHEWLDALEVLRLVLGTQLDVSEDMTHADIDVDSDDPEAQQYFVYGYLSMLQGEIIDALSAALPPSGSEPEDGP